LRGGFSLGWYLMVRKFRINALSIFNICFFNYE
jgi:hypothetical protein